MGETVNTDNERASKKSFFHGVKAEFNKIVWPDGATVKKQSIAVVSASVALGIIIAILDLVIKNGLNVILNLQL